MPVIVMKNSRDKWVSAFIVPEKGACEYSVKAVAREMQNMASNRIIV